MTGTNRQGNPINIALDVTCACVLQLSKLGRLGDIEVPLPYELRRLQLGCLPVPGCLGIAVQRLSSAHQRPPPASIWLQFAGPT